VATSGGRASLCERAADGNDMAVAMAPRRQLIPAGAAYVLPLFVVMLLAFNLPIVLMLSWSIAAPPEPFAHYAQIFERPVYLRVLGNTFRIALIATVVCVLLGYPLAYWIRGLPPGRQLIALALVVLPFWVSILVRTYAWIVILGNDGLVNRTLQGLGLAAAPIGFLYNEFGVILGTANILLPFLVLPLFAAMLEVDDRLLQAAASLGAPKRTVFWRVFFPLTLPSLAAGAILVLILTLGFFITPAILGGGRVPMIANMLDLLINRLPRWELAAAISTILLVVTLACYAAYRRVGGRART
jgi:putative spermidine/putrescine transport system permease protein